MNVKGCQYCCELKSENVIVCGFDGSRRRRCELHNCPHFRPSLWYEILSWFVKKQKERMIQK